MPGKVCVSWGGRRARRQAATRIIVAVLVPHLLGLLLLRLLLRGHRAAERGEHASTRRRHGSEGEGERGPATAGTRNHCSKSPSALHPEGLSPLKSRVFAWNRACSFGTYRLCIDSSTCIDTRSIHIDTRHKVDTRSIQGRYKGRYIVRGFSTSPPGALTSTWRAQLAADVGAAEAQRVPRPSSCRSLRHDF